MKRSDYYTLLFLPIFFCLILSGIILASASDSITKDEAVKIFREYYNIEMMQHTGCWLKKYSNNDYERMDSAWFETNDFSNEKRNTLWQLYEGRYEDDPGEYTGETINYFIYSAAEYEEYVNCCKTYMTESMFAPRLKHIDDVTVKIDNIYYTVCMQHQYSFILKPLPETFSKIRIVNCNNNKAIIAADFDTSGIDSLSGEIHEIRLELIWDTSWKICNADWTYVLLDATPITTDEQLTGPFVDTAVHAVCDIYSLFNGYYPLSEASLNWYSDVPAFIYQNSVAYYPGYFGLEQYSVYKDYLNNFCNDSITDQLLSGKNVIESNGILYFGNRSDNLYYSLREALQNASFIIPTNSVNSEITVEVSFSEEGNILSGLKQDRLKFVFSKTSLGWKITGGNFIDKLDELFGIDREYRAEYNPYTGEIPASFVLFFIIFALLMIVEVWRKKVRQNKKSHHRGNRT